MPKASGVKATNKEAVTDSFEALLETEDFKDFIRIATVTDNIPDKELTQLDKDLLVDQYSAWVEDGRPKPKMPELKNRVEEILRIYRRKVNGKQFLSYVVKGKSEQVGMETELTYANINGVVDESLIIARKRFPVMPYTDKLAKELIKKAKRYNPDSFKMYFVFQTMTLGVHNEENFTGDFDSLVTKAMKRELI